MKPGIKTTEFYLALVCEIGIAALQAVKGEVDAGASIAMALIAGAYAASRAYYKKPKES